MHFDSDESLSTDWSGFLLWQCLGKCAITWEHRSSLEEQLQAQEIEREINLSL